VGRFVGLARVSQEERKKMAKGKSMGHSIETQVAFIRRVGESLGHTLAEDLGVGYAVRLTRAELHEQQYPGIYFDDGGPGWAMGSRLRPALSRLIDDAKAKRFDVVIVAYQDRLSRLPEDIKKLYRALKTLGIALVLEGRLIDDKDLLAVGIKAEVSEEAVRSIRLKTKDTLDSLREKGIQLGKPPVGLQFDEKRTGYEPSPMGERIKRLRDSGRSIEEIRKTAGMYEMKDGSKRLLSSSGVRRVLRNLDWLERGTLAENFARLREPVTAKLAEYAAAAEQDRHEFDAMLDAIPGVRYEFK